MLAISFPEPSLVWEKFDRFGGLAIMTFDVKGCRPMALRRRFSPGLPLSFTKIFKVHPC